MMTTIDQETNRSRAGNFQFRQGDDEDSVIFPLSSEEPYRRYYWSVGKELDEILVHDDSSIDMGFMNSGNAPLLDTHKAYQGLGAQIGIVRRAWIENKRLYVEVKFSNRPEAQAIKADVMQGIVRNVSVGYEVTKYEIDEDNETYRVIGWKPKEASFVPLPADETVGIGRSADGTQKEGLMTTQTRSPSDEGTATLPGLAVIDQRSEDERAQAMEESINEITSLASEHNIQDVARSYVLGCMQRGEEPSLPVFRGIARAQIPSGTPLRNEDIGLTDNERQSFSIMEVCRRLADPNYSGGEFEMEAVRAAEQNSERGSRSGGFIIPAEVMNNWSDFRVDGVNSHQVSRSQMQAMMRAAFGTGTSTATNILTTDHLSERFIDNLRNESAVLGAGATMLEGLDSDVEIPGADANIAAAWLASEDANAAESNPSFRKVEMSPKDVAAFTDMTRRMLQQSTIAFEAYVRSQLIEAHRIAIDSAALYGGGASGVPEGVSNITGIGSVTFAAAIPTRSEIIDLRTAVAATNRGRGGAYLGNSNMVGDLQKTKVDAGSGIFLMNDSADRLVGNPFSETNQITDGDLWYGYWPDLLIGMWGGLELGRSTEAKFLSGGLRLRSIQTVDMNVTRVGSFALGNDG
jgi:HK97 family phage major capsid protein/HK97 family phage prohead protease